MDRHPSSKNKTPRRLLKRLCQSRLKGIGNHKFREKPIMQRTVKLSHLYSLFQELLFQVDLLILKSSLIRSLYEKESYHDA